MRIVISKFWTDMSLSKDKCVARYSWVRRASSASPNRMRLSSASTAVM
jgi:hypothetical protein